jgi:hypothetical protein
VTKTEATAILYQALETPTSKWRTNDPKRLSQKLYQTRAKLRETQALDCFDGLQFRISPTEPDSELWIIDQNQLKEAQRAKA